MISAPTELKTSGNRDALSPTQYTRTTAADKACNLIRYYILGIPFWWVLGFDFIVPHCLAALLLLTTTTPHRHFSVSDCALLTTIMTLGLSAYVVGFMALNKVDRFIGALYNLSIWIVGLVVLQHMRHLIQSDDRHRVILFRASSTTFFIFSTLAISTFFVAYAIGSFSLTIPSLFGLIIGDSLPQGAVIVEQSTRLVFTRPDWGLPGIPMPRVTLYSPYPTAAGAVAAVMGSITLLYLQSLRAPAIATLTVEVLIVVVLLLTLSRSIVAGWIAGSLIANILFGTVPRRICACGGLAIMAAVALHSNFNDAVEYREYSSESRFRNYVRAFEQTLAASPVFGLGIKPREEGNHIPIGSHSTIASTFTKGGALGLSLALTFLVVIPAARWFVVVVRCGLGRGIGDDATRAELRSLLTLQVAIWVWLCFEDIDAPATAATLLFMGFASIEAGLTLASRGVLTKHWRGNATPASPRTWP